MTAIAGLPPMRYTAWPALSSIRTLEAFYAMGVARAGAGIQVGHLPRLRKLATHGLGVCAECGTRRGASAAALLIGGAERVISVDLRPTAEAKHLQKLMGARFDYRIADSLTVTFPHCDLLFLDSLHTYDQVSAELKAHAPIVQRWIVFHDTTRNKTKGDDGGPGIRAAIDDWLANTPDWRIVREYPEGPGLLVTERVV